MKKAKAEVAAEGMQDEETLAPESSLTSVFHVASGPSVAASKKPQARAKASAPAAAPGSEMGTALLSIGPAVGAREPDTATLSRTFEKTPPAEISSPAEDVSAAPEAGVTQVMSMLTQKIHAPEGATAVYSVPAAAHLAPFAEPVMMKRSEELSLAEEASAGATQVYHAPKAEKDLHTEVEQPFLDGNVKLTQFIPMLGGAGKPAEAKPSALQNPSAATTAGTPSMDELLKPGGTSRTPVAGAATSVFRPAPAQAMPDEGHSATGSSVASEPTGNVNVTQLLRNIMDSPGAASAGQTSVRKIGKYSPPLEPSEDATGGWVSSGAVDTVPASADRASLRAEAEPVAPQSAPQSVSEASGASSSPALQSAAPAKPAFAFPPYLPIMLMVVIVLLAGIILLLLFRY